MIDDLVTRGVTEPYRMFTSRAEYRLTLARRQCRPAADRQGHRDRLRRIGEGGGISAPRWRRWRRGGALAQSLSVTPNEAERHGLALNKDGQRRSAMDLLSYPNIGMADAIRVWPQLAEIPESIAQQIEIDAKYAVYLDRQAADVAAYRRDEGVELPEDLDYSADDGAVDGSAAEAAKRSGRGPSARRGGSTA